MSAITRMDRLRESLVRNQIEARGIRDPLVLAAMRKVRRELFVLEAHRDAAYSDRPLPIGAGQTISQPYIVAYMIEALSLQGGEKVLEIGAGSGYAAAVLAEIAREVYAIERIELLARLAAANLEAANCHKVRLRYDDGSKGWSDEAPFDAILVSAGAPKVPEPLKQQLAVGGRLVVPVGDDRYRQALIRITRIGASAFRQEVLKRVQFVPLIGVESWPAEDAEIGIRK